MISLATPVLTQSIGDARQRHLDYAERAGHITMIIYSARAEGLRAVELSPRLTAIPTGSRSRFTFAWDAYRLGASVHRARPVDVITTQDPFAAGLAGLLLKRRFGIPLDVQNHSTFIDNPYFLRERPVQNRLLNWLAKGVIRRADTHRVVNRREKAAYAVLGVDPARVQVIPVPINLAQFLNPIPAETLAGLRARLGLRPEHRVALWVGRPVTAKNLPMLFEAVDRARRAVPGLRLVLVGDFSRAAPLRQQAAALGETVVFAGPAAHEELPVYCALCSVYVHSSFYEGMPRVLVEAAAAGRPAVCPDIPGADAAILDGETGFLTRPEDPGDLAEKLVRLLQQPELAEAMGRRARAHALQAFDRDRHIDALVNAWRAAAALRGKGGR